MQAAQGTPGEFVNPHGPSDLVCNREFFTMTEDRPLVKEVCLASHPHACPPGTACSLAMGATAATRCAPASPSARRLTVLSATCRHDARVPHGMLICLGDCPLLLWARGCSAACTALSNPFPQRLLGFLPTSCESCCTPPRCMTNLDCQHSVWGHACHRQCRGPPAACTPQLPTLCALLPAGQGLCAGAPLLREGLCQGDPLHWQGAAGRHRGV